MRPWKYKVNKAFPALVRLSSSQTDRPDYLGVCGQATRSEKSFNNFKRNPSYQVVLEHVSYEQGLEYLKLIKKQDEELWEKIDIFKRNDELGNPVRFSYSEGSFSPTTLRYVKVLADLRERFGSLEKMKIVEIGPAYGGQCAVVALGGGFASYWGVDLPASLKLMEKYMGRLGIQGVKFCAQEDLLVGEQYDLVISNYAISECRRGIQEQYIERILRSAKRGYITYNAIDRPVEKRFDWTPLGVKEFAQRLERYHKLRIEEERPQTGKKTPNMLITWNEEE
jgi:hypothetical protein